jgi:hypothetical protein
MSLSSIKYIKVGMSDVMVTEKGGKRHLHYGSSTLKKKITPLLNIILVNNRKKGITDSSAARVKPLRTMLGESDLEQR